MNINPASRRIGRFKVSQEFIVGNLDAAQAFMSECIVVRCEMAYETMTFNYVAISKHFDEVPDCCEAPEYNVVIERENTGTEEKPVWTDRFVRFEKCPTMPWPKVEVSDKQLKDDLKGLLLAVKSDENQLGILTQSAIRGLLTRHPDLDFVNTSPPSLSLLHVVAEVRYWEDATINGVEDKDGDLIPWRDKDADLWVPVIDINEGRILNWPNDKKASIHYKVCDAGEYWLGDASGKKLVKWNGHYVPDAFLCIGDTGFGDYIIMEVDEQGLIAGWKVPQIKNNEWEAC